MDGVAGDVHHSEPPPPGTVDCLHLLRAASHTASTPSTCLLLLRAAIYSTNLKSNQCRCLPPHSTSAMCWMNGEIGQESGQCWLTPGIHQLLTIHQQCVGWMVRLAKNRANAGQHRTYINLSLHISNMLDVW